MIIQQSVGRCSLDGAVSKYKGFECVGLDLQLLRCADIIGQQSRLSSLVVLVFGSVFEDPGELSVVEVALLVDGCLSEELVHFLVGETVSHRGQQLPQVVFVDETGALLIEAGKGVPDDVLGVGAIESLSEHGQEHGEVDGSRGLTHHALQVLV